ncbi:MAG: undecaprenyl/decaprenyl-phosphate alpha-N-acetylglucosaminyl 1-phosphate transferase, partial [Tannerellaceae bacterium]|nr:undecaprenyl/decaprenyl-phosphate alpha-N-acetylglucosaminyl 1-phosphate transferase [Tannerellaceae bacterium]
MNYMNWAIPIAFLLAVCMARIIIPQVIIVAVKKNLYDEPGGRKLHKGAVPRLGGFSFLPIILFSLAFMLAITYQYDSVIVLKTMRTVFPEMLLLICGLLFLYLIGLWDDLIGARYRIKFIVQILAASFIPVSGLWINNLYGLFGIHYLTPWLGIPLTIFLIVFIVNALNLIDGIDGLASGLSAIALVVLGSFFLLSQALLFAMLAFVTLGVLLPFFYYNVFGKTSRNSKIFMGDTGSLTLGYILSFLAIRLTAVPPALPPLTEGAIMIAFSTLLVPIFDVCRVMLVRLRNKKHLFVADNNHIHHKFLKMGYSPRAAMVRILLMSVLFCSLNILFVHLLNITLLFLINILLWGSLHRWFSHVLNKRALKITLPT